MEKLSSNLRTVAQNRKLFWLLGRLGIKDKEDVGNLVWSHTEGRTSHTSELSFIECMGLIRYLERMLAATRKTTSELVDAGAGGAVAREALDVKRKGVIKAIFRYFELKGQDVTIEYVKGVAARAAGVNYFNEISEVALGRIYNEFCRKQGGLEVKNRI